MAKITLHNDRDNSATYVSNIFIDNYMTSANGEYVKIYLYLLRCMNTRDQSFSITKTADRFDHTEKDIQRALKYWEKMKLLRLEYDADKMISGIYFLNSSGPEENADGNRGKAAAETAPEAASSGQLQGDSRDAANTEKNSVSAQDTSAYPQEGPAKAEKAVPLEPAEEAANARTADAETPAAKPQKKREFTAAELASFQEKENVSELLFVTEHYLKRPLTPTDLNIILYWFDELHFSTDLMEYLIEYCVGKGHTNMRYMDKVALAWKGEGVTTVEQAKRASSSFSQIHFSVMRALGINGRNLVSSEAAYIDKWSKTFGFTPDIITEACRRTIAATHQPSFEYTDGILNNWHKKEVKSISDIAKLDSAFQKSKTTAALQSKAAAPNKFNNFSQRTYDYDKLEEQLLNR